MWEAKLISHKQYENIAIRLDEIGKMFGAGKRALIIHKEKPHFLKMRKRPSFEGEHQRIVRIPLIRRLSPIRIQPRTVVIAFHIEQVRIAVTVSNIKRTIYATALLIYF